MFFSYCFSDILPELVSYWFYDATECYGRSTGAPQTVIVEALIPSVVIFGDEASGR